jgi:hydroxymethylbilane synthase
MKIRESFPHISVQLVEISTSGDRHPHAVLGPEMGQSFFTKEIEEALLEARVDLAVHSCKDLATQLPDGLKLAAIPQREDPRDAVVSARGSLSELPENGQVGTSSPRRQGFLAAVFPHLTFRAQRGNVPTRIDAVDMGEFDATILAAAGLNRLGLSGRITETLSTDLILPAASQGALAIQTRTDDAQTSEAVAPLDHKETRAAVLAERACMRGLQAGCQAPVGVLGRIQGSSLTLEAAVVGPHGIERVVTSGSSAEPASVGREAANRLLEALRLPSLQNVSWSPVPPRAGSA